jgi:hypothetical protein
MSNSAELLFLRIMLKSVGIKLYSKLSNKKKRKNLVKLQEFKRKLKYFYCITFFILWMSICLTEYFLSFIFYYTCFGYINTSAKEDINISTNECVTLCILLYICVFNAVYCNVSSTFL